MAFTEFFCRSGGSNLNGGGLASGAEPSTAAAYTCTNSNWDGTSVFTPTDGSTPASSVAVGDFASVYLDGATVAVYVARVTVVAAGANGAITLSTTAKSGTAPASGATGRTIKVGGAWKGPNAAVSFPFAFITSALTDSGGDAPRVNFKNDATYSVTAAMTHANAGPTVFQGYSSTKGDGGRATIDGGTSGASYIVLTMSAVETDTIDIIFSNNGATSNASLVLVSGGRNIFWRCVATGSRADGFRVSGTDFFGMELEAYANNGSNTANVGGYTMSGAGNRLRRCISHDNAGSNSSGFVVGGNATSFDRCIADTNGQCGFLITSGNAIGLTSCDAYNNVSDGFRVSQNGAFAMILDIENSNFVKNGGYGINRTGTVLLHGEIINCGFGTGTQVNTSGTTNSLSGAVESGSINYASGVTPWVDPANGDFRINLAAAKGAGRGSFLQTAASYAGAIGYPDIGSAQHLDAGGILINPGLSGGLR